MYRQYDSRHDKFGLMPKVMDACFGGGGGSGGGRRDSNITTTNGVTGGNASGNKNTGGDTARTNNAVLSQNAALQNLSKSPAGQFFGVKAP